jgi:hypothetical protein
VTLNFIVSVAIATSTICPYLIFDLKNIFDWCMVGFESKNGHQKYKCLKEIGLCA